MIDKQLFYAIAEKEPYFEDKDVPWIMIDEYEKIWEEMDNYAGCESWKILMDLKDRGWSDWKISGFKIF